MSLLAGAFRRGGAATATTPRRASRWRWPPRSPGSASATPACTSRTPTPTRSPAGSATSGPTATPTGEPMVPHGMAVSLTAPEAFRFTFDAAPERHLRAAALLGPGARAATGPDALPGVLAALMRDVGIPNGLAEVGYGEADVDDLVEGALKQQRLLATAPREVTEEDLAQASCAARWSTGEVTRRLRRPASPRCARARGHATSTTRRWPARSTRRDASLYRVVPPGGRPAARRADELARSSPSPGRTGVPVTMRGAGTSIAGNAVGPGIVVDTAGTSTACSRSTPRRAPRSSSRALVHAALQRAAAPHGLRFGPDPSTHTRCTIGGMIGNNACGSRALGYGRTADNVESARLAPPPATGSHRRRPTGDRALAGPGRAGRRAPGHVRTRVRPVRPPGQRLLPGAPAARARSPRSTGSWSAPRAPWRVVLEATVRLVEDAPVRALPCWATPRWPRPPTPSRRCSRRRTGLVACEGLDARIVDLVRRRRTCPSCRAGAGWLFVEVTGDAEPRRRRAAAAVAAAAGAAGHRVVTDAGRAGRAVADPRGRRRSGRPQS